MKSSISLVCALGCLSMAAHALEIYVDPAGSDANSGTKDEPMASLAAAQKKAREVAGKEMVTVHFADGIYYLPETVVFKASDSGTEKCPVVYKAVNEGGAVLSGGAKLNLQWKPYKNGIFKANTPKGLEIDQLFINGKNQRMARYPNYDPEKKTAAYQGYAADAFSKQRAESWADPTGGYIHAMHKSRWGGYHYRITGKNGSGEVTYEGGWQNNRQMGMHKDYRMVENIFEELDAPGEWFHNSKTSTLYYKPMEGVDLDAATVEVVRLRHLVEFKGTETAPVRFVTLQGFTIRHAARTFMDCKEPLLRSDWAIYRGGAFMLTGTENVSILDCEFDQVGGNAVFVNNYNRNTLVKGCHIHDVGASGVCFVGDPNAVRDPLFEYHETNDLSKIDRTPGPKTDNYPSLGTVEDCLIHGIGRVERQPAGVQLSMASEITVRDCSIYDCARAGINVSEGTWGGHLIERCDVFDTVLETHDHGSFNSWGRDRFWHKDRAYSQKEINKDPNLPFLDAVKTTTIRNSRWRCDHGWDIDLDDGSSNYDIYNNLMLSEGVKGGLKFREGFRRHAWNNITVNNGFHPHVWYDASKDQVYSNIFMTPHKPARMTKPYTDGTMVDRNLYAVDRAAVMKVSNKTGWDKNSVYGDPMFVDPSTGDFRVKEGSPAFEVGFKNFPMDQFGVKKPSLKAQALTPEIPAVGAAKGEASSASAHTMKWQDATLGDLSGEEFSAYGVSEEEGGVTVSGLNRKSKLARAGFENGDLIQAINGRPVKNVKQFNQVIRKMTGEVKFKGVRNQQVIELTVSL
ncbi:right-handed parallel beta-helix repeat-containing protein [Pontiella sp.]|uniref:right-handed parallel beta-helix repeat-containing protein n=1 Tax=Pontiella sp. TaxID=2837462 RepID=UPI00356751F2